MYLKILNWISILDCISGKHGKLDYLELFMASLMKGYLTE